MHQDAYSKEIGEDGAPLWAIVPPPPMLLQGPSDDSRRLTEPVLTAGFNFFADAPATDGRPLQEAFGAAVAGDRAAPRRRPGDPRLRGVQRAGRAATMASSTPSTRTSPTRCTRSTATRRCCSSPSATATSSTRRASRSGPGRTAPASYAPHIYTGWFSIPSQNGWESEDPASSCRAWTRRGAEAAAWANAAVRHRVRL